MTNTTNNAVSEVDIRERIETLLEGIRSGDLGALKTVFAPNLVSFDVEAPLRHLGAETKLQNWEKVFTVYRPPLGYEVRDLTVLVDGDLAVTYAVNRISGTLANGAEAGMWVRWTAAWRRIDGEWLIVHDQASVPMYFPEGRAATDLMP
ncbi:ketosteroid isomerase-like protein [Kribbella aluminosa]|uniref:Ketosteroid isomerase-like protein n=1 Tax=Kribbella aluminosa TaxID=416017 RepID=A0ABS4UN66_9ACTN|nr:nuclear transport factor 2 family protein [Kribbella aluminosa]MBP2353083.1 ketosteroid isomerase-like protein [Kribbella aluminosa]